MKYLRSTLLPLALLAMAVTASAQQVSSGAAQPQAPTRGPIGKIAVINTGAFQSQILEFKAKFDTLERQFEPRVKEVQGLAERITALENTIKTQGNALTPAKVAETTEQIDRMKREYQRKAEDLQAEVGRAQEQAMAPVTEKLTKFAQEYTARRGIALLIDLGNAIQSRTVLWYDPRFDVTKDFIEEYNKAYPMPGAAAPAQPARKP